MSHSGVSVSSFYLLRVSTGSVLLQCANGGVIRGMLGEMVSQVDQCPAPSLNRKVRKNYPPHLFVWQLINICFDRFSCRYIFNPISKDWPFVRSGQSGWWTSLIVIHKRQGCHKSIPVFYFSFALCDNHFKATCQIYR